jgi:acyl dehydratase
VTETGFDEIRFDDLDAINAAASEEFGPFGESVHVSQEKIDTFAELTDDHQWIHTDVERCKTESPFGGPIAHGFLTLSLMPPMMRTVPGPTIVGHRAGVNYGAESLRFLAPVPAGSDIAARSRIVGAVERKNGTLVTSEAAIHVVGAEKPSVLYRLQVLYQG